MLDAPPIIDWSTDADVVQIGRVGDAQVLEQGWCDAKVAAYDQHRRKSEYYAHFNQTLSRVPKRGTEPEHFSYSYVCKTGHPGCSHVQKRRNMTTDKLKQKVLKCNAAHLGAVSPVKTPRKTVPEVDEHHHRMLLALRCAVSNRPFASAEDGFYRLELEYIRPGTTPPSRKTVSEDIKTIHAYARHKLRSKINRSFGKVHCTTDEWSGKLGSAWKAVTVVMLEEGKDLPTSFVLDYVRLRGEHTGKNLALALAECLELWGLKERLGAVVADNATPNDVMIAELSRLINGFLGEAMHVRCFDHSLNLMAKATLSAFYPEKVRKPKATTKKTKRVKGAAPETASESEEDGENTPHEDHLFASLDDVDVGLAAHTELELDGEPLTAAELIVVNLAVNEFAEKVRTLAAEADAVFAEDFGIQCTDAERKSALRIMDVPSKLASKVNHSPQLLEALEHIIVGLNEQIEPSVQRLVTKVPTRWGSEYNCLERHQMLRDAIDDFTSVPRYGCEAYHLLPQDWNQLNGLKNVLNLFDSLIKKFSAYSTFQVADIYEAFEELEVSLDKARNDVDLDKVVRVGANRALFILGKYCNKLDECEVYPIATILTPTKTYRRFRKNIAWADEWKRMPLDKLRHRWILNYKPKPQPKEYLTPEPSLNPYKATTIIADPDSEDDDELDRYLRMKPVSPDRCPNPIRWWLDRTADYPNLSHMAIDYLIIPATSVDAGRAFSACTLMLGKLRTRLSDESFRAGLLLRSWHNAGLLPELSEMAQCLRDADAIPVVQRKRKRPADEDCNGASPRTRVQLDKGEP